MRCCCLLLLATRLLPAACMMGVRGLGVKGLSVRVNPNPNPSAVCIHFPWSLAGVFWASAPFYVLPAERPQFCCVGVCGHAAPTPCRRARKNLGVDNFLEYIVYFW